MTRSRWRPLGAARLRARRVRVFRSPLGLLGRVVDRLVLSRYLERLLRPTHATIRREAEKASGHR